MERHPIHESPFWIVGNKENGYFGVMGKYKITETLGSVIEVELYINTHHWDVIIMIAGIIAATVVAENREGGTVTVNEAYAKKKEKSVGL